MLRNKEIRISIYIWLAVSGLIMGMAYFRWGIEAMLAVVITSLGLGGISFFTTLKRYRTISNFSNEIDKVLHGYSVYDLKGFSEGELGILESEVSKMVERLREQNGNLNKDRQYLADSMADISHQLRTPLTSLNLINELLRDEELDCEKRMELIKEQYRLLERMEWLINTLLKISKLDAGTLAFSHDQVFLEDLIKNSYQPISIAMDLKNQIFEVECEAGSSFYGDMGLTTEAIGNILKNCMEHTPEGGKIIVRGAENPLFTEIVIEDNGPGISKEDIGHIFERFYKGKNSTSSSFGIGLAYARMIVTNQNGTIKAENLENGGSRFKIKLYKGSI